MTGILIKGEIWTQREDNVNKDIQGEDHPDWSDASIGQRTKNFQQTPECKRQGRILL